MERQFKKRNWEQRGGVNSFVVGFSTFVSLVATEKSSRTTQKEAIKSVDKNRGGGGAHPAPLSCDKIDCHKHTATGGNTIAGRGGSGDV